MTGSAQARFRAATAARAVNTNADRATAATCAPWVVIASIVARWKRFHERDVALRFRDRSIASQPRALRPSRRLTRDNVGGSRGGAKCT